ncbi:hypothetical protein VQ042_04870 [Aurantimonas sp. A2-1-M11]|uniref:hypothetical protein n=1 Tax=Aurantimonas sp. A2-1-M11 TaxID=3113712 RepID=UPI002F940C00
MKNVIAISATIVGHSLVAPAAAQSIVPGSDYYDTRNEEMQRQVTAAGGALPSSGQTDDRAYGYAQGETATTGAEPAPVPGSDFYRTEANEAERDAVRR